MRAILPGRPQSTRQALCTAHWDGLRLVTYISGNTAIIFDGFRNILQTIFIDDANSLLAVTIEESSGQIALCDEHNVYIYQPLGREEGILRWSQTYKLETKTKCTITSLSWGSMEELLVGGSQLTLWHTTEYDEPEAIWTQTLANSVAMAYFSNDAGLIASCGQHDRLVKVWRRLSYEVDTTRFDVSYLPHPTTVTNLQWRKPWHAEQNLDNLLYTFCADGQIRVWAYSEPHAVSVVQKIATFDMNASIQPRRMSTSLISTRRFAFILDSRDFSSATEKALQRSTKGTDHALEHLIEVANRSPEICVVLDSLGHMSVWGLENAGYRSRSPVEKFNVALIDGLNMTLPSDTNEKADYIKFCSFAGGRNLSDLSLLVHSFSGQIDWYESPIAVFFDTASRKDRLNLSSSWSGHDSNITHMVRGYQRSKFLSWAEHGKAITWAQNETGALLRKSDLEVLHGLVDVLFLDRLGFVISLHPDSMTIWNVRQSKAKMVAHANLKPKSEAKPQMICKLHQHDNSENVILIAIVFADRVSHLWQLYLPSSRKKSKSNGFHQPLTFIGESPIMDDGQDAVLLRCDNLTNLSYHAQYDQAALVSVSTLGRLTTLEAELGTGESLQWIVKNQLQTRITNPSIVCPVAIGKVAIVSSDGNELTIWDVQQGVREYGQEFHGSDRIEKLKWNSTTNGNLILAICFMYRIVILGQERYTLAQNRKAWFPRQEIRIRDFTTHQIGDVTWLKNSDLAIGAANQIFVVDCTINVEYSDSKPISPKESHRNVSKVIDLNNTTLPVFHPDLLHFLTALGKHRIVHTILLKLYQELKFFTEVDEMPSQLDLNVASLVDESMFTSSANTESHNSEHDKIEEVGQPLEDISEQLKGKLSSANIWQLHRKNQQDLHDFIGVSLAINQHLKSLDPGAIRYLHSFHATPADEQLPWSAIVSATFSTSQEAILEILTRYYDSKITWPIARRLGLFLWLSEPESLRLQFENIARTEYNKHEDRSPVDCSIYYLALNKKSVLQGLWRRTIGVRERDNTLKLLANDFNEPRWKATALKNAYALISKRRFEYAAAWFLLGGSLKDAITVCVNQMNDIQLAFAVARIWDKNVQEKDAVLSQLIDKSLSMAAAKSDQYRWMAIWGYCFTQNYKEAVQTVINPVNKLLSTSHLSELDGEVESSGFRVDDPSLTTLYLHLRDVLGKQGKWTIDVISPREEWSFVMRCVRMYNRMGMHVLALELVTNWKFVEWQTQEIAVETDEKSPETADGEEVKKEQEAELKEKQPKKPPPTQFIEPSASSLLDSFGF